MTHRDGEVFLPWCCRPSTAVCATLSVRGELEDKDKGSFVQQKRGEEGPRDRGGEKDRPVSA